MIQQFASKEETTSLATEHQAIIHGSFRLVGSLVVPLTLSKIHKRTLFTISAALASLSMATGNMLILELDLSKMVQFRQIYLQ